MTKRQERTWLRLFLGCALTRAAMLSYGGGWWLKAHLLCLTRNIAIGIIWRTRDDGYTHIGKGAPEGWEPCTCARKMK